MVDVSVHGGMLTEDGSSWGQKVITPNNNIVLVPEPVVGVPNTADKGRTWGWSPL